MILGANDASKALAFWTRQREKSALSPEEANLFTAVADELRKRVQKPENVNAGDTALAGSLGITTDQIEVLRRIDTQLPVALVRAIESAKAGGLSMDDALAAEGILPKDVAVMRAAGIDVERLGQPKPPPRGPALGVSAPGPAKGVSAPASPRTPAPPATPSPGVSARSEDEILANPRVGDVLTLEGVPYRWDGTAFQSVQ
jgi:hypothetical protein